MALPTRPQATLTTKRGLPAYDPKELAAYRAAMGFDQRDVAQHMKTHQPHVARWESDRYGPLEARFGDRMLASIGP